MPAPAGDGEHLAYPSWQPGEIGIENSLWRRRGVEVYRDIESNRPCKDRSELRIVQEFPRRRAIEKDSAEAKLLDRTLELFGRRFRILQGKAGEAGETGRVRANSGGQFVVYVAGERGSGGCVERIEADGGGGEPLEIE